MIIKAASSQIAKLLMLEMARRSEMEEGGGKREEDRGRERGMR